MKDYSQSQSNVIPLQQRGIEKTFDLHFRNTLEGFLITVDSNHEIKAIIQRHSNPINEGLEDKQITIMATDLDKIGWGSYIDGYDGGRYLVVTEIATTNGVTAIGKIRKIDGVCKFQIDGLYYAFDCISTNYLMYDDKNYTSNTKVFEEDDRRAIAIPWNEYTSKLRIIDEIELNGVLYKAIKVETIQDQIQQTAGIIQIALIRTTFGELTVNDVPLRGLVRFARMKDKKLNSKSRELITEHNQVKTGDYIRHSYARDGLGTIEQRNYIVYSLIDMRLEYDVTYLINCDAEFNLWDNATQQPVSIPCYVEDNRTRLQERTVGNVNLDNSQFQVVIQENELTKNLGRSIQRIILKGEAYQIVGKDNLSLENAIYLGLNASKIDPNKDNEELEIADFTAQYVQPTPTILSIIGDDFIRTNSQKSYTMDYPDKTWTLVGEGATLNYTTNPNEVIIKTDNNSSLIGKTLELICLIGAVEYKKQIKVRGW